MAWALPRTTAYEVAYGERGIVVWAVQRALKRLGRDITLDGDYGPQTKARVAEFQREVGLTPPTSPQVGPGTQRKLVERLLVLYTQGLPGGLLHGFAEGEGGWTLTAVNHSVAGGVDCGAFQRRVYDEDYGNDAVIERAFDAGYQARLLADRLIELRSIFLPRAGTKDSLAPNEKAWRLACLNHNYPSGADTLSRTPVKELTPYWRTEQSWVTGNRYRFPDGVLVRTPLDWCALYALGSREHSTNGSVTRYVTNWTTTAS